MAFVESTYRAPSGATMLVICDSGMRKADCDGRPWYLAHYDRNGKPVGKVMGRYTDSFYAQCAGSRISRQAVPFELPLYERVGQTRDIIRVSKQERDRPYPRKSAS